MYSMRNIPVRQMTLVMLLALLVAGCHTTSMQRQRAIEGAAIGTVAGAIIGGVTTGNPKGVAAGAAIGAAGGAIVAAVASRPGYCWARNSRGERYLVHCPNAW